MVKNLLILKAVIVKDQIVWKSTVNAIRQVFPVVRVASVILVKIL